MLKLGNNLYPFLFFILGLWLKKNPNLIKGKFVFGKRKIGYPKEAVIEFLETYLHMGEDNG